jgi:hypothetical protein
LAQLCRKNAAAILGNSRTCFQLTRTCLNYLDRSTYLGIIWNTLERVLPIWELFEINCGGGSGSDDAQRNHELTTAMC